MERRHPRNRAHSPEEKQAREALKHLRLVLRKHEPAAGEAQEATMEIARWQSRLTSQLRARLSHLPCREQKVLRAVLARGTCLQGLARYLGLSRYMVKTSLRRIYRHLIPCLPYLRAYLQACADARERAQESTYQYPGALPSSVRPKDVPRRIDLQGYRNVGNRAILTPEMVAKALQRPPGPLRPDQLWWVIHVIPHVRRDHPDWSTEQVVERARALSHGQAKLLGKQVISDARFYDNNVPVGGPESDWYSPDGEDD